MYSHLYSLTLRQPEDCSCLVISMSVPYNEATYKQLEGKEKQQIFHEATNKHMIWIIDQ